MGEARSASPSGEYSPWSADALAVSPPSPHRAAKRKCEACHAEAIMNQLPSQDEWDLSKMPTERRARLEAALGISDIATMIADTAVQPAGAPS